MAKTTRADHGEGSVALSALPAGRGGIWRLVSLIVGDVLCILLFVSLGSNAHGKGVHFQYSLWLAIPFWLAWFLIAPLVGAFRFRLFGRPVDMLKRTALAWVATWPVAMGLRWLLVERLNPVSWRSFLSFSAVVLLVNLVLLPGWRGLFALGDFLLTRGKKA